MVKAKKAVSNSSSTAEAVEAVTKPEPVKRVAMSDLVDVKNIGKKVVHTSEGQILPGEKGKCTLAEARTYHKCVEQV
jgi:hypothetical protein